EPGGIGTGSGRSISGVDLGKAVRAAVKDGLLMKGGGHAMAAGVTLRKERLAEFRAYLENALAADVANSRHENELFIDGAVSGGASGIGEAVSELLAREGASVAVTDIDELRGPELVARIKKAGGEAAFWHQDVTSEERWIEVVTEVVARYGRLDVLVSNAGIGIGVPSITQMTLEDWRRQTAINLDGVFLSVKHSLPAMRKGGRGGSIIMMSSLAGLQGAASLSGYCATKGGVRLFA